MTTSRPSATVRRHVLCPTLLCVVQESALYHALQLSADAVLLHLYMLMQRVHIPAPLTSP